MPDKTWKAAERANRTDKIAFMAGSLGSEAPYRSKEYMREVEAAAEKGASYFLTSLPLNEKVIDSMARFAEEVMPSFK